jgi:hypothetical protein
LRLIAAADLIIQNFKELGSQRKYPTRAAPSKRKPLRRLRQNDVTEVPESGEVLDRRQIVCANSVIKAPPGG